jgi:galactose mutarotase-like enzyme
MNMLIDNEDIVLYSENDVYFFEKRISLNKNSLILKYRIKNISENIYPCFYTMHCLFDLYEDMHIIFPKGTDLIENALCDEKLNNKREMHKFFGDRYSIGTDEICSNGYEKFYICGAVSEGKCGIDYRGKDVQADIEWDNNVLPYLGFWITAGGFRGDYNCAWEPSSGYYDSVSRALRNNAVWELLPQEEKQFDITITVHENSQRK